MGNHLINLYEKGRLLEKNVLDYFRYHHFIGCRAAQSRGPYDVIVSPPSTCFTTTTLHIQIGPKSKKELQYLWDIATGHAGFKAHLFFSKMEKQPKIKLLHENEYSHLPAFLMKWYNFEANEYLFGWKEAIHNQTLIDREVRKANKLV